jgi:hypothetical protein
MGKLFFENDPSSKCIGVFASSAWFGSMTAAPLFPERFLE